MARVLVAALIAMIISILAGPWFISFLRRNEFGQQVREEGPQHHVTKQGTPTIVGLLIIAAASIAFLAVSDRTVPALTIFGTALACGAIGFLDDFTKLRHRRPLGLRLLEDAPAAGDHRRGRLRGPSKAGQRLHPDHRLPPRPGWYILVFLIIAGSVNGEPDRRQLRAGTAIIAPRR
jgi:hypothetical protein